MQNLFCAALDMQSCSAHCSFWLAVLKPRVAFFAWSKTTDDNLIMSNDN